MAAKKREDQPKRDPLAEEIDALLKKLPHAEPEPAVRSRPDSPGGARPMVTSPRPPQQPSPSIRRGSEVSTPRARVAVWARVLLGITLGAALTQWPYAHACGWPLLGYGAAVVALMVVGGWSAVSSWRQRTAGAHLAALIVVYWGIVLGAEVILPRIGYAAEQAGWRCVADVASTRPIPAPVSGRTTPPEPDAALANEPGATGESETTTPADTNRTTVGAGTSPDSLPD